MFGRVTLTELTPDEDQQLRDLIDALRVVPDWVRLTSGLQPRLVPGSELAYDDRRAGNYQLSHAAWNAMLAAVSHLACLRDSLFRSTSPDRVEARIDIHGHAALVRGAVENASRVVWMLEPGDSDERLLRRLGMQWSESDSQASVRKLMGLPVKTRDERLRELTDLLPPATTDPDQVKSKRKAIKANSRYSSMVEAAGKHLPSGSSRQEFVWRTCSALAHGDFLGTLGYTDRKVLGEVSPGVMLANVSASVPLLTTGSQMAIGTMQEAWKLYARRTT
jgi:hypothetical protein